MVMSHFPIFNSQVLENANMSAAHYRGDEQLGDYERGEVDSHMKFETRASSSGGGSGGINSRKGGGCETVGEF